MPTLEQTKPVEDTVPKVNDDLAVGDDLEFQRRWWRFERVAWTVLTLLVVLDLLGCFGRGPVAKARWRAGDGSITVHYERIERYGTPSVLTAEFGPGTLRDGKAQLWASESLIKALGNQRVIPQPASSVLNQGGILYTFPAANGPITVQFALEPAQIGPAELRLRVPGVAEMKAGVFVVP